VEVTGTAFLALRTNNYLVYNLAGSFLIAFGVITLLMVFLFRSVKMALISILPNIIPMMIMAAVLGFFSNSFTAQYSYDIRYSIWNCGG
jgi:predicted RND superfamily exporter protein